MKKSLFVLLAFLVCAFQTSKAYEYFTIYFSDGTKSEAFYATDVDSICYSKIDLDSLEHTDWQMQEIYTIDSVYRYPLAQIDSLSFKYVDENKVAEDIANVMKMVDQILLMDDNNVESHLSEIKQIEGVEDVSFENRHISIKISDWGNIVYCYPPNESQTLNSRNLSQAISRVAATILENQPQQSTLKVCIANQQAMDMSRFFFMDVANDMSNAFSAIGVSTTLISMPEPRFFSNDIFEYDIAFIKTHGWYDIKTGLHWLMTGQEVLVRNKDGADYNIERLKQIIQMENFSPRKICLASVDEVRNNDTVEVFYVAVSQEFIRSRVKKGKRNTIIFNTACQSLMGPNWKDEFQNIPNYGMAKAYIDCGAGCYLGYDDSNSIGADAGGYFFLGMMNGLLVKNSYSEVHTYFSDYFHQDNYYYYDENGKRKTDHIKRNNVLYIGESHPTLRCYPENSAIAITYPQTMEAEETTTDKSRQIKLHGSMKFIKSWDSDVFPYFRDCDNCHIFGFCIADNPEMDNMWPIKGMGNYDESNYTFYFEVSLDMSILDKEKTYYYCAYMNDGYSDCYGEVKSFTTPGASLCPDNNHPHTIDMGAAGLWACCNVGASKPEDYGDYFAWGETSPKANYGVDNYKYWNDYYDDGYWHCEIYKYNTYSDYGTVDNKTELDLSDDAAYVNWGSGWRMPSLDQGETLCTNCTWTWTQLNGVNGYKVTATNGNSLFLPAAGGRDDTSLDYTGSGGYYWLRTLNTFNSYCAFGLGFDSGYVVWYDFDRFYGLSVCPVRAPQ